MLVFLDIEFSVAVPINWKTTDTNIVPAIST